MSCFSKTIKHVVKSLVYSVISSDNIPPPPVDVSVRITDEDEIRITDEGETRITD
jgi:hypothetical protein